MPDDTAPPSTPAYISEPFAAAVTQVCQLYGIPPKFGYLYALLFSSAEPLSLAQLTELSGAAKSTTSVVLRKLERYRFVRRRPRGSDRRDYYEAVADPAQILRDWARLFLAPELALGQSMVDELDRGLQRADDDGDLNNASLDVLRDRTKTLRASLAQGAELLAMLTQLPASNISDTKGKT